MNDNEIVDLYLLRDEKAIVITKEKYGRRIKQILYEIIGDYHYVEECEDDCYLNIWNSIPPRIPYDYFFSYITVVARNISINFIKSKKIYPNDISIEYLDKESAMHSFSGLNQINELEDIKSDLTQRINTETEHTRQQLNDKIIDFMKEELTPIKQSIADNKNDMKL